MRSRAKKHQDREAKKARRRRRIATGRRPRRVDMLEKSAEGGMRFRNELMMPIEKQSRKRQAKLDQEAHERRKRRGQDDRSLVERAAEKMGIELP